MRGDGDGWAYSPNGVRHWGLFGAAGLLLRAPLADGTPSVLLQHRAIWSHQGGTWALPGGARDRHETAVQAAVREAEEEAGIDRRLVRVRGERVTARVPSGWTYTTVIADAEKPLATSRNRESAELRWVPEDTVETMRLHPAFRVAWSSLRSRRLRLLLDEVAERPGLADVLPRTIDLGDAGFGWVRTGSGTDPETGVPEVTAVVVDDAGTDRDGVALTVAELLG